MCAEPVTDAEKEHRHWLTSPLFARGLPLQLPAEHRRWLKGACTDAV